MNALSSTSDTMAKKAQWHTSGSGVPWTLGSGSGRLTLFIQLLEWTSLEPQRSLFHKLHKSLSKYNSRFITCTFLAARIVIQHLWSQSSDVLTISNKDWIGSWLMTRRPLPSINKKTKFDKTWQPWIQYLLVDDWGLGWSCPDCSRLLFPQPFYFPTCSFYCVAQFLESWMYHPWSKGYI